MQRYQPEFIEEQTVREILKSCIPFFEENTGRFWLDNINSFELKVLVSEGLNTLEEMGSLNHAISERDSILQLRADARKLNDDINQYNNLISNYLRDESLTPEKAHQLRQMRENYVDEIHYDPKGLYLEKGFFLAWQKALEATPEGNSPNPVDEQEDLSISVFNPLVREGLLCQKGKMFYPNPERFKNLRDFFTQFFRFYKDNSKYARPSEEEMKKLYWIKDRKNGVIEPMNSNTVHNYYSTCTCGS